MIELTPLDVRKKREDFRRTMRGYDPEQVEAFLDLVAERFESLVEKETRLTEQVRMMSEQLRTFQERERALNDALVTAQELREDARAQAEQMAESRLRDAEREAETMSRGAEFAVAQSQERLDELVLRRTHFLRSFRATLLRFMDEVEFEEARLAVITEPADDGQEAAQEAAGEAAAPADVNSAAGEAAQEETEEGTEEAAVDAAEESDDEDLEHSGPDGYAAEEKESTDDSGASHGRFA
ncbi:MAG: DivIVA domain-containing protein [Gemmatimonadota bacterium]